MNDLCICTMVLGHLQEQKKSFGTIFEEFGKISRVPVTQECKIGLTHIMLNIGNILNQNKNLLQCLNYYFKCNQHSHMQQNLMLPTCSNNNNNSTEPAIKKDLEIIKLAAESTKPMMLQYQHETQSSTTSLVLNTNPQAVPVVNQFPVVLPLQPPSETSSSLAGSDHSSMSSDVFHNNSSNQTQPNIEFGDVGSIDRCQFEGSVVNGRRPALAHSKSDSPNNSSDIEKQRLSKRRSKTESDTQNPNERDAHSSGPTLPSAATFYSGNRLSTKCLRTVFKQFIQNQLPNQNSWFSFIRLGLNLSNQDINHITEDYKDNAFARKFSFLEKWAEDKVFQSEQEVWNLLEEACKSAT